MAGWILRVFLVSEALTETLEAAGISSPNFEGTGIAKKFPSFPWEKLTLPVNLFGG